MNASDGRVVVVTGAAGFLGSALTVDLARRHTVIAIDRREPSQALLGATESVDWHQMDINDERSMATVFQETRRRLGRIDFVLHFAAFAYVGESVADPAKYYRNNSIHFLPLPVDI